MPRWADAQDARYPRDLADARAAGTESAAIRRKNLALPLQGLPWMR